MGNLVIEEQSRKNRVIGTSGNLVIGKSSEGNMHQIWGERFAETYGPKDGFGLSPEEDALGLNEEERALWAETYTDPERVVIQRRRDERRFREHQGRTKEQEKQAWPASKAGQLLKKLGECFAEYKECLEQDPRLREQGLAFDEMNQKIFNKMRNSIDRANDSPRCRFEKMNGQPCRAPKVRGKKYCHMHQTMEEARPEKISLPVLSDANSIQAAIAKGAQALVDGKLERKQASTLGYYLQLALSNVGRVDFDKDGEGQKIG
jgi:hypothetical protein